MHDTFPDYDQGTNDSLLRFTGLSDQMDLMRCSIAFQLYSGNNYVWFNILIYNAFSISVSERTKQFGLLSSIGATRNR